VAQQQKAECSQKLEGLNVWLAGAAGLLASQRGGAESCDVDALQEKQKRLKVQPFWSPEGRRPTRLSVVGFHVHSAP